MEGSRADECVCVCVSVLGSPDLQSVCSLRLPLYLSRSLSLSSGYLHFSVLFSFSSSSPSLTKRSGGQ